MGFDTILSQQVHDLLRDRFIIVHGNRLEASVLNLMLMGAIPHVDAFFTAVAGNGHPNIRKIVATEDESNEHGDLCWGNPVHWEQIAELLEEHPDAVVIPTYRKPGHEKLQEQFPDMTLLCPPVELASWAEDKGYLTGILTASQVAQTIPEILYDDASEIPSYWEVADIVGEEFVVQILDSAGGARHDLKSSIVFVSCEMDFDSAISHQTGHGPVRVATWIKGIESNGEACTLPWGTYISPPSNKPVGLRELNGRIGSGAGNDWSTAPSDQTDLCRYETNLTRVGAYLARQGYIGVFGMDHIFPGAWPHEINGRSQGTSEARERALIRAGLPPFSLMAIAHALGVPETYFPKPEHFNQFAMESSPGWYLKYNVGIQTLATRNLNGLWTLQDGKLVDHDPTGNGLSMRTDQLYIYGAPKQGKLCKPGTALPTLYVNGLEETVFTPDQELTEYGHRVIKAVHAALSQ